MAVHIRAKRVTAPLDDDARARLRGVPACASSGSDHGAASCLSGLVHAFLETGGHHTPCAAADNGGGGGGGSDRDESLEDDDAVDRDRAAAEIVRELMCPAADMNPLRRQLAGDVSKAAEGLAWLRPSCGGSALRRAVMARLRAAGYNAGICKASWDASGGLAAGSYEYIDVVAAAGKGEGGGQGKRYIVDLEFAAEFEVARATEEYKAVAAALPRVAVAGVETMRQVVRAVADAARRSLRARGLHVPPWRKSRYMLAKWLGPYRRTTKPVPASLFDAASDVKCRAVGFPPPSPPTAAAGSRGGEVKCRAVGFPAAAGLVPAPTARTR